MLKSQPHNPIVVVRGPSSAPLARRNGTADLQTGHPSKSFYYTVFLAVAACVAVLWIIPLFTKLVIGRQKAGESGSGHPGRDDHNPAGRVNSSGSTDLLSIARARSWKLTWLYLPVYLLATLADWFQGPYVFALYRSYGYDINTVETLFLLGFLSSMVFGTFVGSLADTIGRKKSALLYCLIYGACCVTKHFSNFAMLIIGRILGGIATSLLFSCFEAWLVHEHNKIHFPSKSAADKSVSDIFAKAIFFNGVVAIFSGQVAQLFVSWFPLTPPVKKIELAENDMTFYSGEDITPFDLSAFTVILCALSILCLWKENYGLQKSPAIQKEKEGLLGNDNAYNCEVGAAEKDATASHQPAHSSSTFRNCRKAAHAILYDRKTFLCGLISCSFEAGMYIFVILWTPALTYTAKDGSEESPPCGLIFSTFMLCCMIGAQSYSVVSHQLESVRDKCLTAVLVVAGVSLSTPLWTKDISIRFFAFLIFEISVGFYFPAIGTLKSIFVEDSVRATVYNIFRIPLNAIVASILLAKLKNLTTKFLLATVLMGISSTACLAL